MLNNSKITLLEYTNSFKNYETYKNLNKKCAFTCLNLYKLVYGKWAKIKVKSITFFFIDNKCNKDLCNS